MAFTQLLSMSLYPFLFHFIQPPVDCVCWGEEKQRKEIRRCLVRTGGQIHIQHPKKVGTYINLPPLCTQSELLILGKVTTITKERKERKDDEKRIKKTHKKKFYGLAPSKKGWLNYTDKV